jgi:hypothetical protein
MHSRKIAPDYLIIELVSRSIISVIAELSAIRAPVVRAAMFDQITLDDLVVIAGGPHPIPSRTRQ